MVCEENIVAHTLGFVGYPDSFSSRPLYPVMNDEQ
jgi:hypothetical protein